MLFIHRERYRDGARGNRDVTAYRLWKVTTRTDQFSPGPAPKGKPVNPIHDSAAGATQRA
jgi:hypothetical protein